MSTTASRIDRVRLRLRRPAGSPAGLDGLAHTAGVATGATMGATMGATTQARRVRQALTDWLEAADAAGHGRPAEAIVLLKHWRVSWQALQQPAQPALALALNSAQHGLPRDGATVSAGCDAVWFGNEAEVLAGMAGDSLSGALPQRWWWRQLTGQPLHQGLVEQRWVASPRHVPLALSLMNTSDEDTTWLRRMREASRLALIDALASAFPTDETVLTWVRHGDTAAPWGHSDVGARLARLCRALHARPQDAAQWQRFVTHIAAAGPDWRRASGSSTSDAAETSDANGSAWAHGLAHGRWLASQDEAVSDVETGTEPTLDGMSRDGLARRTVHRSARGAAQSDTQGADHRGAKTKTKTTTTSAAHAPALQRDSSSAWHDLAPSADARTGSGHAAKEGAAQALHPSHPHGSEQAWDAAQRGAADGRSQGAGLSGATVQPWPTEPKTQPPLASLRAHEATRHSRADAPDATSARGFDAATSSDASRDTPATPIGHATDQPTARSPRTPRSHDRKQTHGSDRGANPNWTTHNTAVGQAPARIDTQFAGAFFLLNAAVAMGWYGDFTQPRHRGLAASPWQFLHAAGQALAGPGWRADPLADWLLAMDPTPLPRSGLGALWPPLRARLALALGLPRMQAVRLTLHMPGQVRLRPGRLDVHMALCDLPLAVRMAGLDRDIGWLPAAGLDIRFHFDVVLP